MADDPDPTDAALPDPDLDTDPDTDIDIDVDLVFDDAPGDDDPDFTPQSDPVRTARRRHRAAGAMLAAGMFGIDVALGRKPKEEVPVVVDSPTEPTDVDTDGIRVEVDESTTVVAPALPRRDPPPRRLRRRRTR